jgi:tetratricopeptide (TPR) repeat protein
VILWRSPEGEDVAPPEAARALLGQALARDPDNPALHLKLAGVALDRFDFAAAANSLETVLRLDPAAPYVRPALARCRNMLGHYSAALRAFAPSDPAEYERGFALIRLGRPAEAEVELRALLDADPHHRHACRQLCKLLRKSGRGVETLALCEALHARGARHAQLFHDWGWALALAGETDKARALLLDPERVAEIALPVPDGFADISAFNAALSEEILSNPHGLGEFPTGEEANRGSRRVHALFAGRSPELVRGLLTTLQRLVEAWSPAPVGAFDPWPAARPGTARLNAGGLIQRGSDYEEWHIHRGGWLSGVYYVRVPPMVATHSDGRGCIEYGPPPRLASAMPGLIPSRRHIPREGFLLLAPSHYPHRTIPTGAAEPRISFAFDVVPDG